MPHVIVVRLRSTVKEDGTMCPVCGICCPSEEELRSHVRKEHPEMINDPTEASAR